MNGIEETMTKCIHEIDMSQKIYTEKTNKASEALIE